MADEPHDEEEWDYAAAMEDSSVAARLEDILSHHNLTIPPELQQEIKLLKEGKIDRGWVIDNLMTELVRGNFNRKRLLLALDLLHEWVFAGEVGSTLCELLMKLRHAIAELDNGIVEPILAPRKLTHRTPDSRSVRAIKITAAAACEELRHFTPDLKSAASSVARLLAKHRFPDAKRSPTPGAILFWRKKYKHEAAFKVQVDIFKAVGKTLHPGNVGNAAAATEILDWVDRQFQSSHLREFWEKLILPLEPGS